MADADWPLMSRAIAASDPPPVERDDEPVRGNALLRLLAAESEGRMVEVAPGCFYESKIGSPPPA